MIFDAFFIRVNEGINRFVGQVSVENGSTIIHDYNKQLGGTMDG